MTLLLPPTSAGAPAGFRTTQRGLSLACYQLYAVERWVAARDAHPLLLVYTGHAEHRVTVDAHAAADSHAWDAALAALRAHGAKPRQTAHGTLMLTSLAHFRSDYTIVHIPDGLFPAAAPQLYANIDLLRMACSARSALTLEDPSDSTKDRFIAAYHLPDNTLVPAPHSSDHLPLPLTTPSPRTSPQIPHLRPSLAPTRPQNQSTPSRDRLLLGKTKDRPAFVSTVLELVKLIQASLQIFGLFPADFLPHVPIDGLLCDYTLQGLEKWAALIGVPCLGLQNTDRIADPSFVAALLSLVLATRNRLAYLGYSFILPRDPFLYPHAFSLGLSAYIQATAPPSGPNHHHQLFASSVHVSTPLIPLAPPPTSVLSAAAASAAAAIAGTPAPLPTGAVLTRDVIDGITALYEQKMRTESRRVRHVLKNKLAPSVDSDGAEGSGTTDRDREYSRKHTLSLSKSLSGGEEPAQNALSTSTSSNPGKSQQLLSGIASGLRGGSAALANVGVNVGGGGGGVSASGDNAYAGDPGALLTPTADLAAFVRCVSGNSLSNPRSSGKGHRRSRDSADIGLSGGAAAAAAAASAAIGHAYAHAHERDVVVGASVRALWSGRVADLVRMREEVEALQEAGALGAMPPDTRSVKEQRGKVVKRRREGSPSGVASDGDDSTAPRSYDGRSTEEESDMTHTSHAGGSQSFGGMWSGRVRGKIGTWTGLGRRKHYSVDLGMTSSTGTASSLPGSKDKDRARARERLGERTRESQSPPSQPDPQASSSSKTQLPDQQSPPRQLEKAQRLSSRPTPSRLETAGGIMNRRASAASRSVSRAQSPTLPPMVFSTDMDRDVDDDDLLSSGQVSPISDYRPNPFNLHHDPNASAGAHSSTNLSALGPLLGAAQKRPWSRRLVQSARVASWADPISARSGGEDAEDDLEPDFDAPAYDPDADDTHGRRIPRSVGSDEDGEETQSDASRLGVGITRKPREKARFHSLLSVVDGAGVRAEEVLESSDYEEEEEEGEGYEERDGYLTEDEDGVLHRRRAVAAGVDLRRRRSFHDLDTYRGVEVLSPEHMAMDVEICGELLTMRRREEHLRNVIACVRILSSSLSHTNTSLRAHYESHTSATAEIERRASVLAELDAENVQADKIFQATNTLRYESEQFHADDLWQAARPTRRAVFALRDKVLGTGGRRLRTGVHGAHGAYDRLQWALDGRARHVDHLGRTESEAEEEHALERLGVYLDRAEAAAEAAEEAEGDVVEHPGIKPMWLLRFFTSWGARWSAVASAPAVVGVAADTEQEKGRERESTPPASAPVVSDAPLVVPEEKPEKPSRSATQ